MKKNDKGLALLVGMFFVATMTAKAVEGPEVFKPSYRVPSEDQELEEQGKFPLDDALAKMVAVTLRNGATAQKMELRYTIPEELTGNSPQIRVRLQSSLPFATKIKNISSEQRIVFKGVLVKGPCRWKDELSSDKASVEQIPLCPETLDANDSQVFAPATTYCHIHQQEKAPRIECSVGYMNLFTSQENETRLPLVEKLIEKKYAGDAMSKKRNDLLAIAHLWSHEAVGVFTIPLEVK